MENSIESIWKKGFLHETSLVAPKINDLYNQKSKHAVDRVKRMFRINQIVIVMMSVLMPAIHYFVDALWQGITASGLMLLTLWYNDRIIRSIKTLDQGATSFDYLQAFDRWLNDVLLKAERIVRISYPLYMLIAFSTIGSAWNKQGLPLKLQQRFPHFLSIDTISVVALIVAGLTTLLMVLFSARIYRWEVRLMYGRVFDKLKDTIAEMEKLRHE